MCSEAWTCFSYTTHKCPVAGSTIFIETLYFWCCSDPVTRPIQKQISRLGKVKWAGKQRDFKRVIFFFFFIRWVTVAEPAANRCRYVLLFTVRGKSWEKMRDLLESYKYDKGQIREKQERLHSTGRQHFKEKSKTYANVILSAFVSHSRYIIFKKPLFSLKLL